jgi:transposase|tara:strand:+ start:379 stop:828 length:450 start_codon:yes stop_codon:yes gene_type:complete
MIVLTSKHKYYLCDVSVDIRKDFDGLSGLVRSYLQRNPLDGSGYVFMNAQRKRIKILLWEGDVFSMYYKRLEKGTFDHPIVTRGGDHYSIIYDQLAMILKGIKWEKIERKRRCKIGVLRDKIRISMLCHSKNYILNMSGLKPKMNTLEK